MTNFDPYQALVDCQRAIIELTQANLQLNEQLGQIINIVNNLNLRQDILNEQLKLVINQQKNIN